MTDVKRWRGLKALVQDVVEQGASAIERVHLATADRPFEILERVLPNAEPIAEIHALHHAIVSGAYGSVRAVTRVVGQGLDVALDALEMSNASEAPGASDPQDTPRPRVD